MTDPRVDIWKTDNSKRKLDELSQTETTTYEIRLNNHTLPQVVELLNLTAKNNIFYYCPGQTKFTQSAEVLEDLGDESNAQNIETNEDRRYTGYFCGDIEKITRDLALTFEISVDRIDDSYYFGANQTAVKKFFTTKSFESQLEANELQNLANSIDSELKIVSYNTRGVVFGSCESVKNFLVALEKIKERPRSYVISLAFVTLEKTAVSKLEAEISTTSLDLLSKGWKLYDVFDAQLGLKSSTTNVYDYNEVILYATDSKESSFNFGTTHDREKRAISDAGTSTVQGYESVKDGTTLTIMPKRSFNNIVDLTLKFESSAFSDVATFAKNETSFDYKGISLRENQIYYICSFAATRKALSTKLLGIGNDDNRKVKTLWLVVTPVK